jgi:hypothetical protein
VERMMGERLRLFRKAVSMQELSVVLDLIGMA